MATIDFELPPDGDVTELVARIDDTVVFANFSPGVDEDQVPPRSALSLFGNRGPWVPLATWTPGEIGLQHGAGQRVWDTLAERGVPVPEEWYVAGKNPKRGLVLKTYRFPPSDTVPWLARAATVLRPFEIDRPWPVRIRTRDR
jgi:hypothetical protein